MLVSNSNAFIHLIYCVSLLVIEHVMRAIMSLSDRIAVLHHGQLIAVGDPATITADERVVEAYLGEEFTLAAD